MKKKAERCPYCHKLTRIVWEPTDREGSGWHRQTGQVDGRWVCAICGKEM